MEMFEGAAEAGRQKRKDSERKRWVYILMTSVAAVSPASTGARAQRGS